MRRWQNKDTLYTGYNEDKNWPHPQNRNTSLIARVHDSKWVVYLAGKKNPKAGQTAWLKNGSVVLVLMRTADVDEELSRQDQWYCIIEIC